jgi:CRISPR-associated endonuclease/helicase Cas3
MDVLTHCTIVGEVAKALIQRSIPAVKKQFFPPGSELIAASHDLGKLNPLFQEKIRRALPGYTPNSLPGLESARPDLEKSHAAVSQAALEDWGEYIPKILGRHHGYSSDNYSANSEYFGGEPWQKLRMNLLEQLRRHFGDIDFPEVKDDTHAAVLSGLTCVADWIGSGSTFDGIKRVEDLKDLPERVQNAVDKAGFVLPAVKQELSFKALFGFDPRPAQSLFIEAVSSPGVYVLEAQMGMGKTEAALYAAYTVLAQGKASGIYFALPTKLTSDKIFTRMNEFLDVALEKNTPLRKSLLLHSSAWLRATEMGEEGEPGGAWFHTRKRGLLAPFAVGTIDQALMSVMNVKHGFVRAFGLAGKAVILDEVHSYDSYTGALLDILVQTLREMGCTVIILSATLTDERRRNLLGKAGAGAPSAYPLISVMKGAKLQEIPAGVPDAKDLMIRRIGDDEAALAEALKRADEGQQVLWIENTVDEAQKAYRLLSARAAECGVETGLLHSRFVQKDRTINEKKWVDLYGKEGKEKRKKTGRILVGTQVLEQSLDIDADFLVTRLCPTDMLFQRFGRLWRHEEHDEVRPQSAIQEAWILGANYAETLKHKKALGKTVYVYDPYILLRTLEVWEHREHIRLPQDIRPLVEETYRERTETGTLGKLKERLRKERETLQNFALLGVARSGKTLPDVNARTRYSEMETQDVLLLRSVRKTDDGNLALTLSDGTPLTLTPSLRDKREYAAELTKHIVSVPEKQVPQAVFPRTLALLKEYIYVETGEHGESSLYVAILKDSGELTGIDYTEVSKGFTLSYDKTIGYRAEKRDHLEEDDEW